MLNLDKQTLRKLEPEILKALTIIEVKHGVKFKFKGGTIGVGHQDVVYRLEMAVVNPDGTVNTREVNDFREMATQFGLEPDDLGQDFIHGGRRYTICGLIPKRYKFPILATRDGKKFKFPEAVVQKALGRKPKHDRHGLLM